MNLETKRLSADALRQAHRPSAKQRRRSQCLGLGQRQRRHRQDARSDVARAAPAARRYVAGAHPLPHLHEGRRLGNVEARFRPAGRMGDGRRRDAQERRSASLRAPKSPTPTSNSRGRSLPAPSKRPAASRCRRSMPLPSACCRDFRSRPACRRISRSSTTMQRATSRPKPSSRTLIEATAAPSSPLGKALDVVVRYAADVQFDKLISERRRRSAAGSKSLSGQALGQGGGCVRRNRKHFCAKASGFARRVALTDIHRECAGVLSKDDIREICAHLSTGTMTDQKHAELLTRRRDSKPTPQRCADVLADYFLVDKGEAKRSSLMTNGSRHGATRSARPVPAGSTEIFRTVARTQGADADRSVGGALQARGRRAAALHGCAKRGAARSTSMTSF